jgi:hypothetical protein
MSELKPGEEFYQKDVEMKPEMVDGQPPRKCGDSVANWKSRKMFQCRRRIGDGAGMTRTVHIHRVSPA